MTTAEVAALAGVTPRTVQRAVALGHLRAQRRKRRGQYELFIAAADARAWAASDRRPGPKPPRAAPGRAGEEER